MNVVNNGLSKCGIVINENAIYINIYRTYVGTYRLAWLPRYLNGSLFDAIHGYGQTLGGG
jgi:hypothetical protein